MKKLKHLSHLKMAAAILMLWLVTPQVTGQTITPAFAQKIANYDGTWGYSCGLARVSKDGKFGFIDKAGNEVVPCQYEEVGYCNDFMAYVRDSNNKYGFIDNMGDLVIPCKYRQVNDFSDGLAWVNEKGPWQCIDKEGNVVFTLEIMSADRTNFIDGLSLVNPPKGETYIVNSKGEAVKLQGHSFLGGISDGLILCCITDSEGYSIKDVYLDTQGNVVLDCSTMEGDYAYNQFSEGLAAIIDIENMKVGYIDKTGRIAIEPTLPYMGFDDLPELEPFMCKEGMILTLKNVDEENGGFDLRYGFVDKSGNLVIPYQYTDAYGFTGGLAAVRNDDGKWGFIDKAGNTVIPFKYDGVSLDSFMDGYASVQLGDKWGYVDKKGNDTF